MVTRAGRSTGLFRLWMRMDFGIFEWQEPAGLAARRPARVGTGSLQLLWLKTFSTLFSNSCGLKGLAM